jgi:hypothetical protein
VLLAHPGKPACSGAGAFARLTGPSHKNTQKPYKKTTSHALSFNVHEKMP